ncbi:PEP-CTERM protein-sorting domain-containing protein [Janthinobacterium sp. TND4EL3]|uniref:FxDxF family PEP-CTERM protein n=1 Tax=Janthinobacterium sp. TND4EL3 TaxID=1907311 RepID=UPI000956E01F|nr:FxDxF family PEP-CTERM protein [Janthinobacterium sp. TND4EL3]SIQ62618.1 PEP-CTERM protein-sorting domain-containing protein [Janthinobacterium sp. TND4EL3]
MKNNTRPILAVLAFAGSVLLSQAATAAVDISSLPKAVKLDNGGSLTFGDKFKNNQQGGFFSDVFTFNVTQPSALNVILTSQSTSALTGLNLTGFGLYSSVGDTLLHGGTQELSGATDKWSLSFTHLAAGAYYMKVSGDIVSTTGATFSANGSLVSAVPEPETYAMLLAGLGLLGCMARRRQKSA